MGSFSCPHLDVVNDYCRRLRTDCVPGRKGCIVPASTGFLVSAEERVRRLEEEKRQCRQAGHQPIPRGEISES